MEYGSGAVVRNNLVYDHADWNVYVGRYSYGWKDNDVVIENNTLHGGNGIFIGNPRAVTNRNNIVWAAGSGKYALRIEYLPSGSDVFLSDYNDLYTSDGASVGYWWGTQTDLADWQHAAGRDLQSFSENPLFVEADGADGTLGGTNAWDDNFHLCSTVGSYTGNAFTAQSSLNFETNIAMSACVDAGDPTMDAGVELAPHGSRINLGVFGGTKDGSLSTEQRQMALYSPVGGTVIRGAFRVAWLTTGPWTAGEGVRLKYSDDGGGELVPSAGGGRHCLPARIL